MHWKLVNLGGGGGGGGEFNKILQGGVQVGPKKDYVICELSLKLKLDPSSVNKQVKVPDKNALDSPHSVQV